MEAGLTRPQQTLVLCLSFIAGTGYYLLDFNIYLPVIFLIALFYIVFKKLVSQRLLLISLIVFSLAVIYADYRTPAPDELYKQAPAKLELTGRVITEPCTDLKNKTNFYFKTDKGRTLVTIYDYKRKFENIKIGDILEVKGSVKRPYKATNWGQFDYGEYLKTKGIFTLAHVGYKDWKILESPGFGLWQGARKLNEIKNKIVSVHAQNLKPPKLEVLGGMVFGDQAVPAPEKIEDAFIKSGLLHLLAASGLNVGIIFGVWYFLASKIKIGFRPKIITGMLLVALYSLMTGLPPSVTRAALMLEFVLVGKLLDGKADNTILLVMVCALMLLFDPLMLANVGFQLSFIVTFGLLIAIPILIEKTKPVPEWLSGAVFIPLVAQVFAAPVQVFHFNNFAIYSVLANMAVIPFVSIISFAGFVGSIFALVPVIGEKICFLADKIAEPFIWLLLFVSDFVAGLPEALQYLPRPEISVILVFYSLLVLAIFRRKEAVIVFLVLLVFLFKGDFNKNLEFVFFDVGQGDAILIKTPSNRYLLIDTGPPGRYSPAKTAIIPYFRDRGINRLDALVLTHPDSDHIGGAVNILKEVDVQTIYHNGIKNNTNIFKQIAGILYQNSYKTEIINKQKTLIFDDDLTLIAIRPENTAIGDDNEDSIMLYIVYKDFSALLMADCEADSLDIIDDMVKAPVNLLKVGHHGSDGAVNREFMKYINPEISVISVGTKGYQWGHPGPETISLLEEYESDVFRTDRDNAIKVVTDGEKTAIIKFGD